MGNLKKYILSPYAVILLISYYGVWLIWNDVKIPFSNPVGAISYLPSLHYNPENNVLRFLLAILLPPLMCLLYYLIAPKTSKFVSFFSERKWLHRTLCAGVVVASLLLALGMGMIEGSENPANNQFGYPTTEGSPAIVDTFHEGETLGPASLYQQKDQKPYRNFVIVHGAFQDPLRSVIAFKIFGRSVGASRAFTAILLMFTFVLYFALLLVLFRGNIYKSAGALAILGLVLSPRSSLPFIASGVVGVNLPFRDIATLLFFIFAIVGLRSAIKYRRNYHIAATAITGFVVAASFADSFDRALYISVLSVLWLAMISVILPWSRFWRATLLPFIVGLLAGLPVLGLALKWDYVDFFKYVLTVSKYKEFLDGTIFTRPNLGYSVIFILTGVCITAVGAWFVKQIEAAKTGKQKVLSKAYVKSLREKLAVGVKSHYVVVLLVAATVLFLRSAVGRADAGHIAYSIQWLYLLIVYVVIEYLLKAVPQYKRLLALLSVILLFFTLAYYAGSVKRTDIALYTFPIHRKDSEVIPPQYIQTANYLNKNLAKDQTFVTLTSEGIYYYLVPKPSPIKYPIVWYAFTADERTQIANTIAQDKQIKYIVTNTNWTSDFDYVPNPVRFPEIYKVLYQDYKPQTGFGQQTVWVRNPGT